eukprot:scaffold222956_cov21-Tisochrysis_lutea.AAC.1
MHAPTATSPSTAAMAASVQGFQRNCRRACFCAAPWSAGEEGRCERQDCKQHAPPPLGRTLPAAVLAVTEESAVQAPDSLRTNWWGWVLLELPHPNRLATLLVVVYVGETEEAEGALGLSLPSTSSARDCSQPLRVPEIAYRDVCARGGGTSKPIPCRGP